jgi:hypothetical protein
MKFVAIRLGQLVTIFLIPLNWIGMCLVLVPLLFSANPRGLGS